MFRELFGLPAHALIVHAAVVFIPLAAVAAILYVAWPGVRKHIWWAVLGLGVLAPVTAWSARLSGDQYEIWWQEHGVSGPVVDEINNHQSLGGLLSWWATGLGVVMLAAVLYLLPAKARASGAANSPVVRVITVVATVLAAAGTLYYAIRTGDAGARISHNDI